MTTFFVLIWFASGVQMEKFDTLDECKNARRVLIETSDEHGSWFGRLRVSENEAYCQMVTE